MSMDSPKVSVIMSVYNGEKYLKEAINSILNQTFKDYEFIIVNDASTDKSIKILEEYAKKDNRIGLIHNEKNIGLTRSLNKAIKSANGAYIARQDADDISLPPRLEEEVNFLDKHPTVGLVGSYAWMIDEKGKILSDFKICTDNEDIKKKIVNGNQFICGSGFVNILM